MDSIASGFVPSRHKAWALHLRIEFHILCVALSFCFTYFIILPGSDDTGNETVCYKCENGYYGTECDLQCNTNCLANLTSDLPTCDTLDGICTFGCKDKYYGIRCDRHCSNKCQQSLCERDGVCSVGCAFDILGGPR